MVLLVTHQTIFRRVIAEFHMLNDIVLEQRSERAIYRVVTDIRIGLSNVFVHFFGRQVFIFIFYEKISLHAHLRA